MPDIIIYGLLLLTALPQPFIFSTLNRERGLGKDRSHPFINKPVIYFVFTAMNIVLAMFTVVAKNDYPTYMLLTSAIMLYISYFVGFSPSWGECFPWEKPTHNESFAFGVRSIADKVSGFKYTSETPVDKAIEWKTNAMSARWTLYFIPKYIIIATLTTSIIPLLGVITLPFYGRVYNYAFKKDGKEPVDKAERLSGYLMGFVDSLLLAWCFLAWKYLPY